MKPKAVPQLVPSKADKPEDEAQQPLELEAGATEVKGLALVGQAAAAIFVREASEKSFAEIDAAKCQIDAWLGGTGTIPDWPYLERLSPALPHSGRHEAILLPWKAALDALSNDAAKR